MIVLSCELHPELKSPANSKKKAVTFYGHGLLLLNCYCGLAVFPTC